MFINGHALGRFWQIGPQQTLYLPGCWLRKGDNEVIVLDVIGPRETTLWGEAKPILDQLRPDNTQQNVEQVRPNLSALTPCMEGTVPAQCNTYHTLRLSQPAKGRYLAFRMLSTHDGQPATVAEIYLQGTNGKRIDRTKWQVGYMSSANPQGNHSADKAFDLQESIYLQVLPNDEAPLLVIDLGEEQTVTSLEYLPQTGNKRTGCVKTCAAYLFSK